MNQDIVWGPLIQIELGAGTLDGQSLIEMNNLASGYLWPKQKGEQRTGESEVK